MSLFKTIVADPPWNGWQWLTKAGVMHAVEVMLLDSEKDKWQRQRA